MTQVQAQIVHEDSIDGTLMIDTSTGHRLQFGMAHGTGGDGFCHSHQSFDCYDELKSFERQAIAEAKRGPGFMLQGDHVRLKADHTCRGMITLAQAPREMIGAPGAPWEPQSGEWTYSILWKHGKWKTSASYHSEQCLELDPEWWNAND